MDEPSNKLIPVNRKGRQPRTTLGPRELEFCTNYVLLGKESSAYLVTFKPKGLTDQMISRRASKLFKRPMVTKQIGELLQAGLVKADLTIERTLKEIARIAYADPRKLVDANGAIKPLSAMSDDEAATIGELTQDDIFDDEGAKRGVKVKVKQWNKLDALEKAMKHLGLYREDNAQQGESIAITVELVQ